MMRFCALAVVCLLPLGACGGGGNETDVDPNTVGYLVGGFIPELNLVRLGWIEPRRLETNLFEVRRAGPFDFDVPATDTGVSLNPLETVTGTTFDDLNIERGQRYVYQVVPIRASGNPGRASDLLWIDVLAARDALSPSGEIFSDLCEATQRASLAAPDVVRRPSAVETTPVVQVRTFRQEPEQATLLWSIMKRGAGSGTPVESQSISLSSGCSTVTATTNTDLSNPDLEDYAVRAELRTNDASSSVFFPYDDAIEQLRLFNLEPPLGSTLGPGQHTFRAEVEFTASDPQTRQLAFLLRSLDADGRATLLSGRPVSISDASGTAQFAAEISLPTDAVQVRIEAVFTEGSLDTALVRDEVYYAVVP